ncbi:type I glyceraldehyde-3-phosphate dehydrogenase [Methylocystis sp.]|uniref:type I glyceraldehyde-3-phosphate dehydrogenase n=1 Tax=Methylocystis sp. TaxID=1911079 RepID=UPI003DA315D8
MSIRVGINGAGRIGRAFVRYASSTEDLEVVAINDVTDIETIARLLRRDSTYGRFDKDVVVDGTTLLIDGRKIAVSTMRDPDLIGWAEADVDVVVECTGKFRTRDAAAGHLRAGAHSVLLSAPGTDVDLTIVMGVNDDQYDPDVHEIVSNASCTTNCVAPMVKVLHDSFGIDHGFMTTVHAYTGDQRLLDAPHKDPRRSRSAAVNIIPTTTGAARAVGKVLPELDGRLDGVALRVPVVDGSLVDLAVLLERDVTVQEVNDAFHQAATTGPLAGILRYSEEPLVSSDVIGDDASCVFDSGLTQVAGRFVKAFGWYDNEWGYTRRLADATRLLGRS